MIIDIVKWLFLYCLVVFAFGCGMNQLLWYYADLERQQCYHLPGGKPDFDGNIMRAPIMTVENYCGTGNHYVG